MWQCILDPAQSFTLAPAMLERTLKLLAGQKKKYDVKRSSLKTLGGSRDILEHSGLENNARQQIHLQKAPQQGLLARKAYLSKPTPNVSDYHRKVVQSDSDAFICPL